MDFEDDDPDNPYFTDYDPRNVNAKLRAKLRAHLEFIQPTREGLQMLLGESADRLDQMAERVLKDQIAAALEGRPAPEPTVHDAAEIIAVAQGVHFALDAWFRKFIVAVRDADLATRKPKTPASDTLH